MDIKYPETSTSVNQGPFIVKAEPPRVGYARASLKYFRKAGPTPLTIMMLVIMVVTFPIWLPIEWTLRIRKEIKEIEKLAKEPL